MIFWRKKEIKDKSFDSGYFYEGLEKEWNDLTDEKLTYAIEESRLYLQNIFDSTACLSQKAMFLLTIVVGLIGYIFVEFVLKYKQLDINTFLLYPVAGYVGILILSFILLNRFILPTINIYSVGNAPKNLLKKDKMMNFCFKEIIVSQLENYQDRINHNTKQNIKKARYIKLCIWLLVGYPILVIAALFIAFLFYLL